MREVDDTKQWDRGKSDPDYVTPQTDINIFQVEVENGQAMVGDGQV